MSLVRRLVVPEPGVAIDPEQRTSDPGVSLQPRVHVLPQRRGRRASTNAAAGVATLCRYCSRWLLK